MKPKKASLASKHNRSVEKLGPHIQNQQPYDPEIAAANVDRERRQRLEREIASSPVLKLFNITEADRQAKLQIGILLDDIAGRSPQDVIQLFERFIFDLEELYLKAFRSKRGFEPSRGQHAEILKLKVLPQAIDVYDAFPVHPKLGDDYYARLHRLALRIQQLDEPLDLSRKELLERCKKERGWSTDAEVYNNAQPSVDRKEFWKWKTGKLPDGCAVDLRIKALIG